jgi:hypothetical protein
LTLNSAIFDSKVADLAARSLWSSVSKLDESGMPGIEIRSVPTGRELRYVAVLNQFGPSVRLLLARRARKGQSFIVLQGFVVTTVIHFNHDVFSLLVSAA